MCFQKMPHGPIVSSYQVLKSAKNIQYKIQLQKSTVKRSISIIRIFDINLGKVCFVFTDNTKLINLGSFLFGKDINLIVTV